MSPPDPFDPQALDAVPVEAESQIDIREYLYRLRRRWKLIAAAVVLAVGAGGVQYLITPKMYRAETIIQIERRSLTPFTNSQTPWLENWWNMEYYPTQYRLLESRGLAERVLRDLRLMDDPAFNPAAPRAQAGGDERPSVDADRAVLGGMANRLRAGLSVEPIAATQLARISYQSSSPELAARIANGFAQVFIEWGIEARSSTVGKASSFLGKQIEELKREIGEREARLQAFSRDEDIINFQPEANVVYQRLQSLNADYMQAVRKRIEKQALYEERAATPKQTVADVESSGLVSDILKEQLELERQYETQLKTFKPDWPPMQELKAKIEQGRKHLDEVIETETRRAVQTAFAEYQTALRQEQKLATEIDRAKSEAMDQNLATVEFSNLQVEITTRRSLLDELLRKQSETEVAARLQDTRDSNVRIVDEALVPGAPFRPSLRNNLSMGLLAGLLLGLGAVFLVEFMDRSIKTAEELERLLGLPVLAVIPDISDTGRRYGYGYGYGYGARQRAKGKVPPQRWVEKKKSEPPSVELVPHLRPRQVVSEAYRSLRTALLLSSAEALKVVAVTSADAGEGKTATVANLGVVMAQLGRRVLIVDGDLRKPRLHEVFGVSNRDGLVSYLTGTAAPEAVVLRTAVPNLAVTPSGPVPPNPSELLASERMRHFLTMAGERFDLIVVDSPPALAVTDATVIGSHATGVVLCFRAGKILREHARSCRDRLRMADVRLLGCVFNRHHEGRGRYGKNYRDYAAYGESGAEAPADSAA